MGMIFPGKDPYLEDPQIWPELHSRLIVYLADHLRPLLRPRYFARIEARVFVEGPDREIIPDVWLRQRVQPSAAMGAVAVLDKEDAPVVVRCPQLEITESYITILDRRSGMKVVTTIEIVSPTNKYSGPGRDSYLAKQPEVRASATHLVEIDLLRTGPHVLAVAEPVAKALEKYDYLVCVNRASGTRELFDLYPRTLQDRLPRFSLPLAERDPDVKVDLQAIFNLAYENGDYASQIEYDRPCRPPLSRKDQAWANTLIRKHRTKENGKKSKKVVSD